MKKILLVGFIVLTACTSALYKESVQDAQDATQANARAYQLSIESDSGAGVRAFNRVAYCLTSAILRNEKQEVVDAGIACSVGSE